MYCKRCGARIAQGMLICPECGARQRRQASTVRCANCHGRVSVDMVMCPHCGRTVRPAAPRWALWFLAMLTVGLVSLYGLGRLPIAELLGEVNSARERLASIVQIPNLDTPVLAGSPDEGTPVAAQFEGTVFPADSGETPVEGGVQVPSATIAASLPVATSATSSATTQVAAEIPATTTLTATASMPATPTATPIPSASATSSRTLAPTPTSTPTVTKTPTVTVTPTPSATPTPSGFVVYRIRSGDTLGSVGARFDVSWQELARINKIADTTSLHVGQEILIPVTATSGPPAVSPTVTGTQ